MVSQIQSYKMLYNASQCQSVFSYTVRTVKNGKPCVPTGV